MRIRVFYFKQKTAYERRISDWSSDVCSSDLTHVGNHDQFSLGKTCEHLLGSLRTEKIRQSPAKNKGRHILQCVQSWPQVYACLPARQTQGLGNTHIIIKHDTSAAGQPIEAL